jgi:uncharacterized membrane protein
MTAHDIVLGIHNIVRWVALILGIVAFGRALAGWLGRREWTKDDRRWGMLFTTAMDIQLLLGVILYFFLSPITRQALSNFGQAMSVPDLRFFGLEHALYMVVAVIAAHVGSALSRRGDDSKRRFRIAALLYGLAVILMVAGIPWSRPLLPGLGGA